MRPHSKTAAWRATAFLNTGLTISLFALLSAFLIVASKQSNITNGILTFNHGECETLSKLNLTLHILVNIISTGILASSNYFMQVLMAPTREEVDRAHVRGNWLNIGIPSSSNLLSVSRAKGILWLLFVLSSLPIHIFFNSVIFMSQHITTDFTLIMGSTAFVHSGPYYIPGASLAANWTRSPPQDIDTLEIQSVKTANQEAAGWETLHPRDCMDAIVSCSSRTRYRDIVIIIDTPSNTTTSNWTRSEVYNTKNSTVNDLSLWDAIIPPNAINTLWSVSRCTRLGKSSSDACANSCGLHTRSDIQVSNSKDDRNWTFPTFPYGVPEGFDPAFNIVNVSHCLAEATPNKLCTVMMSNTVLLVTTICIFLKSSLCLVAIWTLWEGDLLVTLGDAIQSFLEVPDAMTRDISTILKNGEQPCGVADAKLGIYGRLATDDILSSIFVVVMSLTHVITSLVYTIPSLISSIPFQKTRSKRKLRLGGPFNSWLGSMKGQFIGPVLTANAPQLYLSMMYLLYSSAVTKGMMAREWALLSTTYRPLRVTRPSGEQTSTYFLGLPYRYSIPILAISPILHWVLSQAIYVVILDGSKLSQVLMN
ncbi:hypothetical protein GQ53DRAFT_637984 [Thozetella sp. PMI_491]|nr:hypothetical protein GQ53DRAFT_637984 [Thozetella sp. PMI_491]